jgi:hypothetical protein
LQQQKEVGRSVLSLFRVIAERIPIRCISSLATLVPTPTQSWSGWSRAKRHSDGAGQM